jgi:hypothetical protein
MKTTNEILTFVDDQIITQSEDLKMISSATFNSLINIILIKYYIYILSDEGMCYFNKKLNEIDNYYSSLAIPLSCVMPKCYLLIGLINSNNKVSLYLYGYISNSFESGFYDN